VVYTALYGDRGLWVRPLVMFRESVNIDGQAVPRFAPIDTDAAAHSVLDIRD
ncbi:DUF1653 domain-containing protein, partial [Glaciimonas sp. Cout2]